MAKINSSTSEKVVSIKQFLGLHESKDGDNKLKLGEATICRNFKITNDGNLKKREGSVTLFNLNQTQSSSSPVKGLWHGWVNKHELFLAACDGKLYSLYNESTGTLYTTPQVLGNITTTNDITFIPFENKVYMLNGTQYCQLYWVIDALHPTGHWVFENIGTGTLGYRPLVVITLSPSGDGATLEQINKLNGQRRVWISPDGNAVTFTMPESPLQSVDYVKNLSTGNIVPTTDYSTNLIGGTITFTSALSEATNSYEIGYTVATNFASSVCAMKYAEMYSGTQDTRIFIYGDGSNETFYTGIDYNGNPRGDYFPDLNEIAVGDSNTPITGMTKHSTNLAVFKPSNSTTTAFSINYGVTTLSDSSVIPAFYVTSTNKTIGNDAPGQVQLVENAPYTLSSGSLYEWRNASAYSASLTTDERQAKRKSDRVYATLGSYKFENCHCYDDNLNKIYYIINNDGNMLCYNYFADAWYEYTGLNAYKIMEFHGTVYIGTRYGRILKLDETIYDDDEQAIDCQWESGSMDFGASYMRKFSAMLWVGIKSELDNEIYVTVESDRSDELAIMSVDPDYNTNKPQVKRCKIKVKKFTFFKLIFRSFSNSKRVTVVDTDIKVRYTSYTK